MLLPLLALSISAVIAQNRPMHLLKPRNWTSCDTFLNNTVFDPKSVIDVDWKIFYFWNPEMETTYTIRFRRPSKMLLERFQVELDKEIQPPVNWTDAEFFMETSIDFSALYLRTNQTGLYRIIPAVAFEFTSIPYLLFGLKVVKEGYLGIVNCQHGLCYALAPSNKMPNESQLEAAALTIGFFSEYNRSISTDAPPLMMTTSLHDMEDLDDEVAYNNELF